MDNRISIECLAEEVFEYIAKYLNSTDIDACFNVCVAWRRYFNKNKIWKRCCLYPDKYIRNCVNAKVESINKETCIGRYYYKHELNILNNLCNGAYIIEKTGILGSKIQFLHSFVDDYGQFWLFDLNNSVDHKIVVYNFTKSLVFHQEVCDKDGSYQIWPLNDKVLTCFSNCIKVFIFRYPEYDFRLEYRLMFEMNEVIPNDAVISADDCSPGGRFVCVGSLLVGCFENIINIYQSMLHIWNLDSGKKIATKSIYQQKFADFVYLKSGRSVISDFKGGVLLFEGNDHQFVITLIDDTSQLSQVTLFDTDSMSYSHVIAQLESRTAWCSMKGTVIAIYHPNDINSQISVYDIKGVLLAKLDFHARYNPMLSDEFWFDGSRIFLVDNDNVKVLYISSCMKVRRSSFAIEKMCAILNFYPPKCLLLYNKLTCEGDHNESCLLITVWDTEHGIKLWTFPKLTRNYGYLTALKNTVFPHRLLVQLKNDDELSVIKFQNIGI